MGSNPCWNGGRIFFSRVDFLCWLLFRYPFHPRVTTVAHKKSRSFCQKCRWQVTAKTHIHLTYVAFIEPCFSIGHNLSLICQMTSEDIKHQLIIIITRINPSLISLVVSVDIKHHVYLLTRISKWFWTAHSTKIQLSWLRLHIQCE